ncbi:MAG: hemin uptake protein HemP [Parvularcula sp.]|jgi:hemin uptake protein HemP|nr:hemin uptake protein HemP [Parvularcula sp.]
MTDETRTTEPSSRPRRPVHDARSLLAGCDTAEIVLDDNSVYILRLTRTGKLILTK